MKTLIIAFCLFSGIKTTQANGQDRGNQELPYRLYLTQVAAAEAYFQLNKISMAHDYLDACNVKFRDLEWQFLRSALDQSQNSIAIPGGHYYTDIRISPDGGILAAAGSDSLIHLFDYPGLKPLRELAGHRALVSTLAFSSDGKKLASGGRDHKVIIWEVKSGKPIAENSQSFMQGIYQVRFNPDNTRLGVVSWERIVSRPPGIFGFVKLLDGSNAKEIKRIELDNHPASGVVFTPDGKTMIISTWGEIAYSFQLEDGRQNWVYDLSNWKDYNAFHAIDISPDGKTIALGSADHRVHLLNTSDGSVQRLIEPWEGHTRLLKSVRFSSDGSQLATAGEDQAIKIWKTEGYTHLGSFTGHINTVSGLDWSRDGNRLISASLDGTLKVWDLHRPFKKIYSTNSYGPWQTPFTSDHKYFAAPGSDKRMGVYEASTGQPYLTLGEQSGLCGDISRDSRWLVTASFDGVVRLYDLMEKREVRSWAGHTARVDGIAYLNETGRILSVGDTTLRVWDASIDKLIKAVAFSDSPFRIGVTPDEKLAVIGFGNGVVKILDTRTWQETGTFRCDSDLTELTISSDGRSVAIFSGKNIEIRDVKTLQKKMILSGHEKPGYGLGFSPDARYLISGSYDQTFKLWNLLTGVCTLTFHPFEDAVYNCKILTGNNVFLSSPEGEIRYFTIKPVTK